MHDPSAITTYLFTDIEGSTGHWEREPERMRVALERHDEILRERVIIHHGTVVKTTGDGMLAVFPEPLDAVRAAAALQLALTDAPATNGIALHVRCGLHAGVDAQRGNDYYGNAVNRAARVMDAAHGGQVLVSQAVATLVVARLPDDLSLLDLGLVRLRGLAQPERVWQLMHPSLRQRFPALRSLEATPSNLPQQLTSFVARERELAEVTKALGETRLLTLVGGGGLGKTRLSLQVAMGVLDGYPDGAWLVELAPVGDPRLVPQAVASTLGVKEDPGHPVLDALLRFARSRRLLLVLDNCEHLVHSCAEFARRLLEAAPDVTILASSREPLNIRGERTYVLAPLPVPGPAPAVRAEAIAAFAAVQLFADRAAAAQPSFRITDHNASAVAEICRQLDGIPLALELACARLRSMSVERIAERLSDRFRLLTGGDRTALPRQQTLRALIDWSHDLLEERERVLFRRLAVFAGGFTLDAAAAVGATAGLDETDVLDLLPRLTEKSLVTLDSGGERYRMLETVRQYAQECLVQEGEDEPTREAHLAHFLSFAERARPELLRPNQGAWLSRLDHELENLLVAHRWCDHAPGGAGRGLELIRSIHFYWFSRGLLALGMQLTLEALARPGAELRDLARCRSLSSAGQFALYMGRYPDARRHLEESLSIARELDDPTRIAAVLQPLGMASLGEGDIANARLRLDEAVALAEASGNRREIAAALTALAQLHRAEGNLDEAEQLDTRALAICRELGDRESIAIGLLNLAMVALARGSAQPARAMLAQGMAIAQEIGSKPAGQCAIEVAAGLAAMATQWARAARYFGAAEAQAAQTGIRRDLADEAFLSPLMARVRDALDPEAFDAAAGTGKALAFEEAMAEARAWVEASDLLSP